jgi:hypothetical protein
MIISNSNDSNRKNTLAELAGCALLGTTLLLPLEALGSSDTPVAERVAATRQDRDAQSVKEIVQSFGLRMQLLQEEIGSLPVEQAAEMKEKFQKELLPSFKVVALRSSATGSDYAYITLKTFSERLKDFEQRLGLGSDELPALTFSDLDELFSQLPEETRSPLRREAESRYGRLMNSDLIQNNRLCTQWTKRALGERIEAKSEELTDLSNKVSSTSQGTEVHLRTQIALTQCENQLEELELLKRDLPRFAGGSPYRRECLTWRAMEGMDTLQAQNELDSIAKHRTVQEMTTDQRQMLWRVLNEIVDDGGSFEEFGSFLLTPDNSSTAGSLKRLELFDSLSQENRSALLDLANARPEVLSSVDARETPLLSHLQLLASTPLDSSLEPLREEVLAAALNDLTSPGGIGQENQGTCSIMPVVYDLARTDPAEYMRLLTGLVADGTVTLRGGAELTRMRDSIGDDGSNRPVTQRLLQAALIQLGNDTITEYDNENDQNVLLGTISFGGGLVAESIADVMTEVYGKEFHCYRRVAGRVEPVRMTKP